MGEGNWSTQRKPPTCRKSLANFITYYMLSNYYSNNYQIYTESINNNEIIKKKIETFCI